MLITAILFIVFGILIKYGKNVFPHSWLQYHVKRRKRKI